MKSPYLGNFRLMLKMLKMLKIDMLDVFSTFLDFAKTTFCFHLILICLWTEREVEREMAESFSGSLFLRS